MLIRNQILLLIFNASLISILFYQYTYFGTFPGDTGDTKVVLMMLENFYTSLIIENKSFINFNILYPIKDTAFFSETMWGVAWIYSIFRYLGFNIYESFNFYFSIVIIINFVISFFVFYKLKLSIISCYIAAFIFSCSLPIIAQDVHFHLFFRAAIPLMMLGTLYYFKTKKTIFLTSSIFLLIFQFFCSMYLGVFSFILFTILFILKIKPINFSFKVYVLNIFHELKFYFKNQGRYESIFFWIILSFFIFYCFKYMSVKFYYDFSRGMPEKGLLTFQSFFTTTRSPFIPFVALPKGYPLTEQQAFVGVIPILIFILGLFLKVFKKTNSLNKDILLSGLILLILFFSIGPINIYFLIYSFPGIDGIRAPSRVILILLFPIALFIGITIDKLISNKFKYIALLILFFSWGEVLVSRKSIQNIDVETNLDKSYFENIKNPKEEEIFVFKNIDHNGWNIPLDTSIALYAAKLNIKLMNGFTSFVPKGLGKFKTCDDINDALNYLENYKEKDLTIKSTKGYWKIIPIGFENSCKNIIFKN